MERKQNPQSVIFLLLYNYSQSFFLNEFPRTHAKANEKRNTFENQLFKVPLLSWIKEIFLKIQRYGHIFFSGNIYP